MQLINRIKRFRRRPLVTVCWLDREVSFAVWVLKGKEWQCRKVARRRNESCDAEGYLEELGELVSGEDLGKVRVCWVVIREAWPEMSQPDSRKAELTLALPGWIRRCWEGLEPGDLPDEVVSGLAVLEAALLARPELAEPGTGFLMRVGSRYVLIGRGESGLSFRRVSRRDLVERGSGGRLCREWLLQTRTLFRNRTGLELKRVLVAEETGIHLSQVPDFPVEIQPTGPIVIDGADGTVFPVSACRFLHGSAVVGSESPASRLELAALSQRRRWHVWERRLRTSTCVLLGCWGFLLLGACRHEAILPEIGEATSHEWKRHASDLKVRQERWQRVWTAKEAQSRPFELIARIVRDRPEGVEVNGVRVAVGSNREHVIQLEGTFSGEAANPAFRRWIGELRQPDRIEQVRNLQFTRNLDGIAFSLEGVVRGKTGGDR